MDQKQNLRRNTSVTQTEGTHLTRNSIRRRKPRRFKKLFIFELVVLLFVVGGIFYYTISKKNSTDNTNNTGIGSGKIEDTNNNSNNNSGSNNITPEVTLTPEEIEEKRIEEERIKQLEEVTRILEKANLLAMGYDYDGAIELIQSFEGDYTQFEVLTTAITGYEATKATLDPLGAYDSINQISHIFFHSLIADNSKAFDGDYDANGYNYYMTTVTEFIRMMEQMYADGYVLVSIHDVGSKVTAEDGTTKFVPGEILLPPDKKPFVLSQDDVNYYDYMDGDGFASRIVIDENGRPSTEMIMEDGTVSVGDYDMVPVVETFIQAHPDFSYKGARGIIALTGYEGALGYRTDDKTSPTYEQDKETVKKVAEVLKDWGWEFASHSFGHRNMQTYGYNFIVNDTNRWLEEVGSLIGPTDILIFPYGVDFETTLGEYSSDKYKYLKEAGFNYFCGVYKDPWIHVKDNYVRMTRRPLDGQAMLQFPERLDDLFDINTVIDKDRPPLK